MRNEVKRAKYPTINKYQERNFDNIPNKYNNNEININDNITINSSNTNIKN